MRLGWCGGAFGNPGAPRGTPDLNGSFAWARGSCGNLIRGRGFRGCPERERCVWGVVGFALFAPTFRSGPSRPLRGNGSSPPLARSERHLKLGSVPLGELQTPSRKRDGVFVFGSAKDAHLSAQAHPNPASSHCACPHSVSLSSNRRASVLGDASIARDCSQTLPLTFARSAHACVMDDLGCV